LEIIDICGGGIASKKKPGRFDAVEISLANGVIGGVIMKMDLSDDYKLNAEQINYEIALRASDAFERRAVKDILDGRSNSENLRKAIYYKNLATRLHFEGC
jgi:hypothetical protein